MSDKNGDLVFSSEAAATRSVLYHGLNDINLYVEDENRQYEYEKIFQRLLGNHYSIKTIFAVGGKNKVEAAYREFGKQYHGIPNFYIVDGDFDRYIEAKRVKMIQDDCFIYLKTYNIENYLIDEQACISYAQGLLRQTEATVIQRVDYPSWKARIVSEAKKLFLCYCFVESIKAPEKSVGRSPYQFIDIATGFEKTDGSFDEYQDHVISLSVDYDAQMETIIEAYERENGDDYFNLICGKFLLTCLACHLNKLKNTKTKINEDDFKWFLINEFDVSSLEYVKQRILA